MTDAVARPGAAAVLDVDVAVIGAGAAGLFAALAARGALTGDGSVVQPDDDAPRVLLIDGQATPGKKILISGGGRCNVTNAAAEFTDYWTDAPKHLRSVLRALPVASTLRLFSELGVPTEVEPMGKVFPRSGRARDVLDALLTACREAGVDTRFGTPVERVTPCDDGTWLVDELRVGRIVLATGGRSVPKTGSTGFGLDLAARLGHDLVPPVPALAPVFGAVGEAFAGVTVPAIVRVVSRADGREHTRAAGSLLFTHRGITGPAALDVSHAVEQAERDGVDIRVLVDLWTLADPSGPFAEHLGAPKLPGSCLAEPPRATEVAALDRELHHAAEAEPALTLAQLAARRLPKRLVAALLPDGDTPLGQLPKQVRKEAATVLSALDLEVTGTGGYAKAEVTAGGIPLTELDRRTLESKLAPGLYCCGEVCDATGRLGGFNFQWAWASGFASGRAAGARGR